MNILYLEILNVSLVFIYFEYTNNLTVTSVLWCAVYCGGSGAQKTSELIVAAWGGGRGSQHHHHRPSLLIVRAAADAEIITDFIKKDDKETVKRR